MKRTNIVIFMLFIICSIFVVACDRLPTAPNTSMDNTVYASQFENLSGSQDLKKFDSIDELRAFVEQNTVSNSLYDTANSGVMFKSAGAAPSIGAALTQAETTRGTDAAVGATDYSRTNVQVQGVDEADFIKNDDKYIYLIADNKLVIVDAIDGKNSKIISTTKILNNQTEYYNSPRIQNIFLNKNTVVIFATIYEKALYFDKYNIKPIETYKQNTEVYKYDVSDRNSPVLKDSYVVSGSYYDSRMIDNVVYIITQEGIDNINYYEGPMITYAKTIMRPDIYYFDNPEQNYQLNTITSIDINAQNVIDSKSFMLGYDNTLMVSQSNIYMAYHKQQYWCWTWRCSNQETDSKNRFVTIVAPLLEGELKDNVNNILRQGLSDKQEWSDISNELTKFYKELEGNQTLQDQYSPMFDRIDGALAEYDAKKAMEYDKTVIHKININNGKITYENKGEVDGRLLNQFSMDENNNYLRVATTTNLWLSNGRVEYNNVYVLNNEMNVVGSLKNIAQNETIYATRFMGDKLYAVTYRQIDPFFVIDLGTPTSPKILGYLKVPGYSSYLHPISDTLILGVGKDTGQNQWGGTSTKGVQISLFDVSDFSNPKLVDSYSIGDQGSDTPVLYDHKAFLYSDTKKMLILPVMEVTQHTNSNGYNIKSDVWNGAYVFNVSNNGFGMLGKIAHGTSTNDYYYWNNGAAVKRSIYLDNILYTISGKYIKVNDLNNSLALLRTITLPYSDENVYPVMY